MFRYLIPCVLAISATCASPSAADESARAPASSASLNVLVNRDARGVAIGGYDPVAYFSDGKPMPGDPALRAVHDGASYYFATPEHRWAFLREPERYAPAFGGYCGYAASIKRLSPTDPKLWQIVDGKLVLQHNAYALQLFNQDLAGNYARAKSNWPELRDRNALPRHYVVNVDPEGVAIGGYDPISYFDGTPARGAAEHAARYGGATYWFSSEAHRAKFESNPAHFAPAFGGFCGYAASLGRFAPVDPHIYLVQHDRLVLQHTPEALELYKRDPEASLRKADQNWPTLVARAGL